MSRYPTYPNKSYASDGTDETTPALIDFLLQDIGPESECMDCFAVVDTDDTDFWQSRRGTVQVCLGCSERRAKDVAPEMEEVGA